MLHIRGLPHLKRASNNTALDHRVSDLKNVNITSLGTEWWSSLTADDRWAFCAEEGKTQAIIIYGGLIIWTPWKHVTLKMEIMYIDQLSAFTADTCYSKNSRGAVDGIIDGSVPLTLIQEQARSPHECFCYYLSTFCCEKGLFVFICGLLAALEST